MQRAEKLHALHPLITMHLLLSIVEHLMSTLTVRNLDDSIKLGLRMRAAQHGWSMEQEVRHILQTVVSGNTPEDLARSFAERVNQRFKGLGANDLPIPHRQAPRPEPDFS